MDIKRAKIPNRIGIALSVVLFGVPAALLWLATHALMPRLLARGWEPLLAWFFSGGLVLVPLLAAALIGGAMAIQSTSQARLLEHLRVRKMTSSDWRLAGFAIGGTIAATAGLHALNVLVWPQLPTQPDFIQFRPLATDQLYLLAVWLPFFAVNIIGEELWWRGFIQPRQEPVFGANTWIVQGVLHGAFHFSFGPGVLLVLLPVVFIIPWSVQRSQNTCVGIVVHGSINGPAFLAINLGLLPS
jgi:membrane protease YdiL (CAAX protease family)